MFVALLILFLVTHRIQRVYLLKDFIFKDVLNLQSVLFSYLLLGKSFKCCSFCPDNWQLRTFRDKTFNGIDVFLKL